MFLHQVHKYIFLFVSFIFLISIATALNPSESPYGLFEEEPSVEFGGNYTINTNFSGTANFWDLLDTPADILHNLLSNLAWSVAGHTIDTDFDIGGYTFKGLYNWTSADNWNIFDGSTLTFNETKLSTQYFNASVIQAVRGTTAGEIEHLQTYDNNPYNVTEAAGANGLDFRINFTGIEDFNQIKVRYKSIEGEGHIMYLQIYDSIIDSWENYYVFGSTPNYVNLGFSVDDSADHIIDNVVQIRFYQEDNGNTNHVHYFDWVVLAEGYGTPSSQEIDPYSWHREPNGETGNFSTTGNITAQYFNGVNISNFSNVYVPYIGATGNVNLGSNDLTTTGIIGGSIISGILVGNIKTNSIKNSDGSKDLFAWDGSEIDVGQNMNLGIYDLLTTGNIGSFGSPASEIYANQLVANNFLYANNMISTGGASLLSWDGSEIDVWQNTNFNSKNISGVIDLSASGDVNLSYDTGGQVGLGTSSPSSNYKVHLQNTNTDRARALMVEHITASTTDISSVLTFKLTSTGDMANTFGPGFIYAIQDTAGVENFVVRTSGERYGADNTGQFAVSLWEAGTLRYNILRVRPTQVLVGGGVAGVDYQLLFDGENTNGVITYMEDEAQFDFDRTIKTSGNLTISKLINLEVTTLPSCNSGTNGSIGRNGTGVYGCKNSGIWGQIF